MLCIYISMLSTTGQKLRLVQDEIIKKFNQIKALRLKKCIIGFDYTRYHHQILGTDACVVSSELCRNITSSINDGQNPATKIGQIVSDLKATNELAYKNISKSAPPEKNLDIDCPWMKCSQCQTMLYSSDLIKEQYAYAQTVMSI